MQRLPQTIHHPRKKTERVIFRIFFAAYNLFSSLLWAQSDYLHEDFEGDFPSNWSVQPNLAAAGFEGWVHRPARQVASAYFPVTGNSKIVALNDDACGQSGCAFSDARLVSPDVALPAGKPAYLLFDVFYRAGEYATAREKADVLVSVNGGTFVALEGFSELSGKNAWRTLRANLSGYAGNTVKIMFRYSDGGGWADGVAFDNVRIYTPPPYDLEFFFFNLEEEEYLATGSYRIAGGVVNKGTQTVGGFIVRWKVNGDDFRVAEPAGLSLAPFDTVYWQHPETLALSAAGRYVVRAEAFIDGVEDPTPDDNAVEKTLFALDSLPYKTALMEMFTSNTCGLCPFAHFWADTLSKYYPSAIVVQHHLEASGPSALDVAESRETYFGLNQSLLPSFVFNRTRLPLQSTVDPQSESASLDASLWEEALVYTLGRPSPLSVGFSVADYDSSSGKYFLEVESRAFAPVGSPLRLNVLVVEDKVRGQGPEYDQANALNDNAAFSPFYQKGNPIRNYEHRHVLRATLGGPWGTRVADSVVAGQRLRQSFEYTPASGVRRENLSFVAVVQEYDEADVFRRRVFNARLARVVGDSLITSRALPTLSVRVYPNPFKEGIFVESVAPIARVVVYGMDGRIAAVPRLENGGLDLSGLATGIYTLEILTENEGVFRSRIVKR